MRRSKFSLSHYNLLTTNMGDLIPLTWFDVLPGDTIQMNTSALVRCAPLIAPVMHPVRVRIHHFYVPLRLLWDTWEDFITGGDDGTFTCTPPYISHSNPSEGSLADYLGIPIYNYAAGAGAIDASAIPFRAYALIYNEWYRDQDLVTELTIDIDDGDGGADTTTNTTIQKVAWEKDYFTTARPWETKGDAVSIPIGTYAPVVEEGSGLPTFQSSVGGGQDVRIKQAAAGLGVEFEATIGAGIYGRWDDTALQADLSSATGTDINDLRLALAIQRYQEARAQYGSRYVEYLRYLGVRSSDSRLQRPEYLGGGRQVIQFSEVLQTGEDYNASGGVGKLYGHGLAAMRTNRFRRFFEEHGIIMTMMSAVPKNIYEGSLHRSWNRDTKEHHFQKELETIGEQAVLNKEVFADHATPDGTFGYQRRYDEYRWHPSRIAGEFRSTLDEWHLARIFGSDPSLNSTFVNCSPATRIFASTATDGLYVMSNHSVQARRIVNRHAKPHTM